MKARFVFEDIGFERSNDPKKALGIGKWEMIKKEFEEDWYKEYSHGEALAWACSRGKKDIAEFLLLNGIDPNYNEGEPLHNAISRGHAEIVKLLLDTGMNQKSLDNSLEDGVKSNLETVKILLDAGASVNSPDVLYNAVWSGDLKILEFLFYKGAKIKDHHQVQGALAYQDNVEMLKVFLAHGLKLIKTDYDILNSAAGRGDAEAVRILLDLGFKVKGALGGKTLIDAAHGGNLEVVKLLINAGADLNATDSDTTYYVEHFSALTNAAERGNTEIVKLLLDSGADIKILNDKAHRMARKNGHTETLELIKDYKKRARSMAGQNKKYEISITK